MRGADIQRSTVFGYLSPEQRVPEDHPLRPIRNMADEGLWNLSEKFDEMYS